MNLRFLETMIAIAERGSLSGAARALGLSHSAVSLQVRALEDEIAVPLLDRTTRPPRLTPAGLALVERARGVVSAVEDIRGLGTGDTLVGSLRVGAVPSTLTGLMPQALAALRVRHPRLQLQVRSDLSSDLAQQVRAGDLDVAILTGGGSGLDGLVARPVGDEPLFLLAPPGAAEPTIPALLRAHPFIWFSRRTWAGQQIERALIERGYRVEAAMEVDSIEAIAKLVEAGIGVAIAPQRIGLGPFGPGLRALPLGTPPQTRTLVLLERARHSRQRLSAALHEELLRIAEGVSPKPAPASGR